MFNSSFLAKATRLIERHFSLNEFTIENKPLQNENNIELVIKYRFQPKFYFRAVYQNDNNPMALVISGQSNEYEKIIVCSLKPGPMMDKEIIKGKDIEDVLNAIESWVSSLDSELSELSTSIKIEKQQKEVDDLLKQADNLPNEYFTVEEAEKIKIKISDLEKTMAENIKQTSDSKESIRNQLDAMKKDFETLKLQISFLTKKGWGESFLIRYNEWTKHPNTTNLLKSGIQAVRGLLIDNPSSDSTN